MLAYDVSKLKPDHNAASSSNFQIYKKKNLCPVITGVMNIKWRKN